MSEQSNAELIAEAKSRAELCDADTREAVRDTGNIVARLAAALEAADRRAEQAEATAEHLHDEDTREIVALTQERDALAAVVEKVRAVIHGPSGLSINEEKVWQIVNSATAPADALREVKAEAWYEGSVAQRMYVDNRRAGRNGTIPRNPYREEQGS